MRAERVGTAAACSLGGRRALQEDGFLLRKGAHGLLLAVADGMGGHAGGAQASQIALEVLDASWRNARRGVRLRKLLQDAFDKANHTILSWSREAGIEGEPGTTLIAAIIRDDAVLIAHVGDSRATLVTESGLFKLTRDHSALADARNRGVPISSEEATRRYGGALLRWVGMKDFAGPEFTPRDGWLHVHGGAVLLLTSDGFHNHATDIDLVTCCTARAPIDERLRTLARLAYHNGSTDNITVAGIEIGTIEKIRNGLPAADPVPEETSVRRQRWLGLRALLLGAGLLAAGFVGLGSTVLLEHLLGGGDQSDHAPMFSRESAVSSLVEDNEEARTSATKETRRLEESGAEALQEADDASEFLAEVLQDTGDGFPGSREREAGTPRRGHRSGTKEPARHVGGERIPREKRALPRDDDSETPAEEEQESGPAAPHSAGPNPTASPHSSARGGGRDPS